MIVRHSVQPQQAVFEIVTETLWRLLVPIDRVVVVDPKGLRRERACLNANGPEKRELLRAVRQTCIFRLALFSRSRSPDVPYEEITETTGVTKLYSGACSTPAPEANPRRETRTFLKVPAGGQPLSVSFRPLAAENFACFDAAMVIFSPL
jgi:hypothetical protein